MRLQLHGIWKHEEGERKQKVITALNLQRFPYNDKGLGEGLKKTPVFIAWHGDQLAEMLARLTTHGQESAAPSVPSARWKSAQFWSRSLFLGKREIAICNEGKEEGVSRCTGLLESPHHTVKDNFLSTFHCYLSSHELVLVNTCALAFTE